MNHSFISALHTFLLTCQSLSACHSELVVLRNLRIPKPQVLLDMADQLDQQKVMPPQPEGYDIRPDYKQDDSKEETLKDKPSGSDGTDRKKKHKSHESCSRHSSADKISTLSPEEADVSFNLTQLGAAVAQACLSVVKMTQAMEDRHNSRIADALLIKKKLEEASVGVIKSMMDDIRAAHTPAGMWRIEKRLSACISAHRAKAL